jgi:hypothetical protein
MKPGMSKEELELRVEAYFAVQMQKAKDKKECAKETYVKELMSEFPAQEEESSTESSKEKTEKEKSTPATPTTATFISSNPTSTNPTTLPIVTNTNPHHSSKEKVNEMKKPLLVPASSEEEFHSQPDTFIDLNTPTSTQDPPQSTKQKDTSPDTKNTRYKDTKSPSERHVSGHNTDNQP